MTRMTLTGDWNEPELNCAGCGASFRLYWQRNGIHTQIEFCPFCGEEVDEVVDRLDGSTDPSEQK